MSCFPARLAAMELEGVVLDDIQTNLHFPPRLSMNELFDPLSCQDQQP
jgi:hypothetical protein